MPFDILYGIDKSIFNPNKIKNKKNYKLIISKQDRKLYGIVYKKNDINHVIIDLRKDSVVTKRFDKKVSTREHKLKGIINSSLSQTISDMGVRSELSFYISNIFGWSIDFFKLKANDHFKVIFEERYIDENKSIGINDIKAIVFSHDRVDYYAFFYPKTNQYFDEKGKSLHKQFLRAPLKYPRITSRFSRKRFHPILKIWRSHKGTDYGAPKGTKIITTADGIVLKKGYTKGNGRYIKIKHNGIYTTQYLHLWKFKKNLKKGDRVKQGDVIGYVGNTGLANGYHVCYRFWQNGRQIDPLKKKFPSLKKINPLDSADYYSVVKKMKAELDKI